jgi:hypothetical protein
MPTLHNCFLLLSTFKNLLDTNLRDIFSDLLPIEDLSLDNGTPDNADSVVKIDLLTSVFERAMFEDLFKISYYHTLEIQMNLEEWSWKLQGIVDHNFDSFQHIPTLLNTALLFHVENIYLCC